MNNNPSSEQVIKNIHEALHHLKTVLNEMPLVQYQYKHGFISHWYFLERVYYMAEYIGTFFVSQVDNDGNGWLSHYFPNGPQKLHKNKIHRTLIRILLQVTDKIVKKLGRDSEYDSYNKNQAIALSNSLLENAKLVASEVFGQTLVEPRETYLTTHYTNDLIFVLEEVKSVIKQYNSTTKVNYSSMDFSLRLTAKNCNFILHMMMYNEAKFKQLLLLQKLNVICEYIEKYNSFDNEIQGFNAREIITRAVELRKALENLIVYIDPRYPFP